MLDRGGLDAVSIVTTDRAHAAAALKAIACGLHVMCEKPLATNHADALREKRMLDQRQDARAVLADLEASIGTSNARRASSGAHSKVNLKKEQPQSWLSKLLGGRKTEK